MENRKYVTMNYSPNSIQSTLPKYSIQKMFFLYADNHFLLFLLHQSRQLLMICLMFSIIFEADIFNLFVCYDCITQVRVATTGQQT